MNLLRDYQKKAIEDIRYHFRRGNAFFTYEKTHTPKTNKKIKKLYEQGKIYNAKPLIVGKKEQ